MSHVFISYSNHNKDYARKLADHLLSQGFEVWIDDRIDYGETWERVIFKAIDDCLAFLVIMTPQSYESDWVLRECHHAGRRNKPPFPVLLDGEEFPRYGITQFVDVRGGRLPPNDFYERLEKAAPRKRDGGADMTDIPGTAKTPDHVGINGDLELKVIRPSKVQKAPDLFPPDVSNVLPLPFEWCNIPAGKVTIEYSDHKTFDVPQFWTAKYPTTNAQYQMFVDAEEGYRNPTWWGFSDEAKLWRNADRPPMVTHLEDPDLPRTEVNWFEATAFCKWLTERFKSSGLDIILPTEQQWQRAAQGDHVRVYPWGNEFDKDRCNSSESGIQKVTPVTQYANGASPYGAMNMSGNVYEWCLSKWEMGATDLKGDGGRVIRGGTYRDSRVNLRAVSRNLSIPANRNNYLGFRVVCCSTSP